jgi:hypothetical protein
MRLLSLWRECEASRDRYIVLKVEMVRERVRFADFVDYSSGKLSAMGRLWRMTIANYAAVGRGPRLNCWEQARIRRDSTIG